MGTVGEPSGHVFRVDRARGPVWYAKYRLPDGRQVQKKIGPGWAERGRPPAGYFTKRTAEAWLRDVLTQARHGTLRGMRSGGATFAEAAEEWLRFIAQDRERKPSTIRDYRSALNAHLLPAFGDRQLESITVDEIEAWRPPSTRPFESHQEQAADSASRDLPAGADGLWSRRQSARARREAPTPFFR